MKLRYPLLISYCKFWIFDFGFLIDGIASLYPLIKQIEYLKSKIRNPNSKIYLSFLPDMKSCLKRNAIMTIAITPVILIRTIFRPLLDQNIYQVAW
jgi:hypothetical protein